MAEKKEKKKGGFLGKLIIMLIVSLGAGYAVAATVGDQIPPEFNFAAQFIEDETLSLTLTCSVVMLFVCGITTF